MVANVFKSSSLLKNKILASYLYSYISFFFTLENKNLLEKRRRRVHEIMKRLQKLNTTLKLAPYKHYSRLSYSKQELTSWPKLF